MRLGVISFLHVLRVYDDEHRVYCSGCGVRKSFLYFTRCARFLYKAILLWPSDEMSGQEQTQRLTQIGHLFRFALQVQYIPYYDDNIDSASPAIAIKNHWSAKPHCLFVLY